MTVADYISIKTGDRTLKIKLTRNIPQAFSTMGGKVKVTVGYRDQPKTCFQCGSLDHEKKDCPDEWTYARTVAETAPVGRRRKQKRMHPELIFTSPPPPENKRKGISSPDTTPPKTAIVGKHSGLLQIVSNYKLQKNLTTARNKR